MKRMTSLMASLIVAVAFFASCGGGQNTEKTEDVVVDEQTVVEEAPVAATEGSEFAAGEKIYKEKCQVCHMETGLGMEGAFPPLVASDYLLSDKVRAIRQVLKGSSGEITVNGKVFNGVMPPQVETDEDAIAVINYVLNTWGNTGGTVTADDVKKAREME